MRAEWGVQSVWIPWPSCKGAQTGTEQMRSCHCGPGVSRHQTPASTTVLITSEFVYGMCTVWGHSGQAMVLQMNVQCSMFIEISAAHCMMMSDGQCPGLVFVATLDNRSPMSAPKNDEGPVCVEKGEGGGQHR